jgi:hypothetical protein
VGAVPSMQTRRALQLSVLVVAMAVTGHLLMHLQPNDHPGLAADHALAGHATPTSTMLEGADGPASAAHGGAHLMAALCMAVLATAGLWRLTALAGGNPSSGRVTPTAEERAVPLQERAPPSARSRIDAGVLLRV